ncbi:MAG: ABC transporter ATP-binding protein [Actinomycetales bacterium]|nr:ABC transporter ATP-binding protein [Actinomycetales bacterium]
MSFSFQTDSDPVLKDVSVAYSAGEFALIAGATGAGKSTLLRAMNGLAPHFTGGNLTGSVAIDGRDLTGREPHDFAHLVGYVNQLAEASFVADTVREELAFGMEQLGVAPDSMATRIAKIAAALDLTEVLDSPLDELSGGFQQRVAIGAALAAGQQILLLDEPTSELDQASADSLLAVLESLSHRSGVTVILAEHRVDRLIGRVDSLTVVGADGVITKHSDPQAFESVAGEAGLMPRSAHKDTSSTLLQTPDSNPVLVASRVSVQYGGTPALENVNLRLCEGSITGIYGPNGSGKSSLLWALQGETTHGGSVEMRNDAGTLTHIPKNLKERLREVAMVPQSASDLLLMHSVEEELRDADQFAGAGLGATATLLENLVGQIDHALHPRDLSSGQQLALALAIQLNKKSRVLLLDEPTRGLDYQAREALAQQLEVLAARGQAILVASHDREFLLRVTSSCLALKDGRVTKAGPTAAVLA